MDSVGLGGWVGEVRKSFIKSIYVVWDIAKTRMQCSLFKSLKDSDFDCLLLGLVPVK